MEIYLNLEKLAQLIRDKRGTECFRQCAREIGLDYTEVERTEKKLIIPDVDDFFKWCIWLQVYPTELIIDKRENVYPMAIYKLNPRKYISEAIVCTWARVSCDKNRLGAIELDTWREYTLLKINDIQPVFGGNTESEPMVLLKMTCPSTGHIHILRVPPEMTDAEAAITWVNHGIHPDRFAQTTKNVINN